MAEIILMEDSASLRRILTRYLQDADHSVTTFDNGLASQDEDLLKRADVLVTDLSMPGVDGRQVLRNANLIAPDLPIIVMTGVERFSDPLLDRAFGYLHKPFEEAALLKLVERATATRNSDSDKNWSENESYFANPQAFAAMDASAMAAPLSFCGPIQKTSLFQRIIQMLRWPRIGAHRKNHSKHLMEDAPKTTTRDD